MVLLGASRLIRIRCSPEGVWVLRGQVVSTTTLATEVDSVRGKRFKQDKGGKIDEPYAAAADQSRAVTTRGGEEVQQQVFLFPLGILSHCARVSMW